MLNTKINLEQELLKVSDKNRKSFTGHHAITEANRLLENKGAEDLEMLRSLGLHHNIVLADEIKGHLMELEEIETTYGKVFSKEEIKEIATKYALKFLKTEKFKGNIDPEILAKIKQFSKDIGVSVADLHLGFNFYILAPQNLFRLDNRPPKPRPPRRDPILFYQLPGNHNDKFRLIHRWGNDLTLWRRLIGWKYASTTNYWFYWFFAFASVTFLPAAYFLGGTNLFVETIISFALGIIGAFIMRFGHRSDDDSYSWADIYNDIFKMKI